MIRYLNEVIKPLVSNLPKMSGYVRTCKDQNGNKNNKLMTVQIMKNYEKSIKRFVLRLKTEKILNWMLYLFMMIDI